MTAKPRLVFMGSPQFAVPCLEVVVQAAEVVAVVTQPDKPAGRGQKERSPAVKQFATSTGLPVLQPESMKRGFAEVLQRLAPDLVIVVAYGKILPPDVLVVPR